MLLKKKKKSRLAVFELGVTVCWSHRMWYLSPNLSHPSEFTSLLKYCPGPDSESISHQWQSAHCELNTELNIIEGRPKKQGLVPALEELQPCCLDRTYLLKMNPSKCLQSSIKECQLRTQRGSAIRVVSSAYLRWLIFLPAIMFPACVLPAQRFSWCTLHRS